jgi:urease accessory protein
MRAIRAIPKGSWSRAPLDTVTLDHDTRSRRRLALVSDHGTSFLLDLPDAVQLHDGDGLLLENDAVIEVRALAEPLLTIRARDPVHLARLAWHIGNRHVAVQVDGARLLIRPDHVIAEMLRQLGAVVEETTAAFEPERGAYHGHSHASH